MPSTNATTILLDTLSLAAADWSGGEPWGVAFSGGRDSAVLLWALVRSVGPGRLAALYVDHGWRPEAERSQEAASVAQWCQRLGVALRQFPPPEGGVASEEAARTHRYRCFQSFLNEHPASPVFLAHHADDQAETILMRLLRGRSWQGLAGMLPRRGPFLRPFLSLPGSLLAEVALEQKIPFYQDSTNLGDGPTRNFLRHRVFPLLKERFPRAVPALNDLAAAWRQMIPSVDPDPEWRLEARGGWIGAAVWDGWSGIVKQAQLLAVATKTQEGLKLSRRFLEALARPDRKSRGQGSGWTWTRSRAVVRWESVVQPASKEYFVLAEPGVVYDLGSYRMSWEKGSFEPRPADTLFLPGIDASRDLVWRSVVSGMTFSSVEDGNWGRAKKRKRLGSLAPDRCALVLQAGFLRAVVDPKAKSILWAETGEEKLNNTGIFVTLV